MNFRRVEFFVIIAIIGIFGVIYALTSQAPQSASPILQQETAGIKYQGVEGQNALELLKASHQVETKSFGDAGEFVTSIDGVAPNASTHFWAFYVNGSQAQVGAGSYVTKSGDLIEWKLEEIK